MFTLAVGVALLYARYDWNLEGGRFAERGFTLSAYLFVIVLPTCFYLARWSLGSMAAAATLTALVFVATTLPYELLGLDQLYYYATRPSYFPIDLELRPPSLEFFPGGTLRSFPYDHAFMPLLFAGGAGAIWGIWWLRARGGRVSARAVPVLLTVAFAFICAQTYLHSGMRSPFTYHAVFVQPEAKQHWYHVFHFRDASGASQADQFAFTPLEDYFQGAPRDGDNELIRRPLSFYMASQLSYFINTFYVWLALNCLFWLAAVAATARFVTRLATPRAGLIAGALTVVGPGFLAFSATPTMYMQNYAAVAIALCLFEELVVRPKGRRLAELALFTAVFTLCALIYDLTPLFVVLLAYGLARGVRAVPLLASLAAAFLVARGFTFMVTGVLNIDIVPTNARQLSISIDAVREMVLHPSLPEWYDAIVETVPSYFRMLLLAFFVLPFVVAAFGVPKLTDLPRRVLVGGLLLMGFVTIAVLQIGEQKIGEVPRLVYPVFPAIYLLAAIALDSGPRRIRPAGWRDIVDRLRVAAPWIVITTMFVLVNVDMFGYPTQYEEFFYNDPPVWLPR